MKNKIAAPLQSALGTLLPAFLFFLSVCFCLMSKSAAILYTALALSGAFLFYSRLRDRIRLPIIILGLFVLFSGISIAYARASKLAMQGFLRNFNAFCLMLILLAFVGGKRPARKLAFILSFCPAVAGLINIDLLSTRLVSTPLLALLSEFSTHFASLPAVEEGVRMLSIFINGNVFAGCAGIGVLLTLGLAASAESPAERCADLVCLFVNSLSFVLVFSMGASGMIVLAFLVYLALERREKRIDLLLLMAETLVVTLLATFPISLTSFSAWTGFQPVPLLCLIFGAALLCLLDRFAIRRAAEWLRGHSRLMAGVTAGIFAAIAVYAVLACNLTGGAVLSPGEDLRRSAYPKPGNYTMAAETDGAVQVRIESQNRSETLMHTSTELYRGALSDAAFTVPDDSLVVYFNFSAEAETRLERASYHGEASEGALRLRYRLLPGFIANRLQGLRANQNAIQRFAFFADGLKLFCQSPLIGLGMGAFANASLSVQSVTYVTYYVHNHYIQCLMELGLIGCVLFLAVLVISALAIWRARGRGGLVPALGAALVFMAGHAAVEVIFSMYCYLPVAFGTFGLISLTCSDALPERLQLKSQRLRAGLLLSCLALLLVFVVLLGCNVAARQIADGSGDLSRYERAARLDPFEWADHQLSYVMASLSSEADDAVRQTADGYAERLAKVDSNTIPLYLAEYYLDTGRIERGLEMARKYVEYTSADAYCWRETFDLLETYEQSTPEYRAAVLELAGMLEDWNAEHLGNLTLTEQNLAFIARMSD